LATLVTPTKILADLGFSMITQNQLNIAGEICYSQNKSEGTAQMVTCSPAVELFFLALK